MQEFCPRCENLLFERTNPSSLTLTCRNCAFEREATELRLISFTSYGEESGVFDDRQLARLARDAKDDPTLPRVNNIPCASSTCPSAKDGRCEIIYYEYDSRNLRFFYVCARCGHAWRRDRDSTATKPAPKPEAKPAEKPATAVATAVATATKELEASETPAVAEEPPEVIAEEEPRPTASRSTVKPASKPRTKPKPKPEPERANEPEPAPELKPASSSRSSKPGSAKRGTGSKSAPP